MSDKIRTIDEWAQEVERLWPFKVAAYPGFETIPLAYRRDAAIRHVLLHCAKDTGRLAAAVERPDHGEVLDEALLHRPARNLLVNALRLCRLLGLRPSALLDDYSRERGAPLDMRP